MNGISEKKHLTKATMWPSGAVTIEHLSDCWCLEPPLSDVLRIGDLGQIYVPVKAQDD